MIQPIVKENLLAALAQMIARVQATSGLSQAEAATLIQSYFATDIEAVDKENTAKVLTPKGGYLSAKAAIAEWVGSSPELLDTIQEIAEALNNDPDAFNTLMNAITENTTEIAAVSARVSIEFDTDNKFFGRAPLAMEDIAEGFYHGQARTALLGTDTVAPLSLFNKDLPVSLSVKVINATNTLQTPVEGEETRKHFFYDARQGHLILSGELDTRSGTPGVVIDWVVVKDPNAVAPVMSGITSVDWTTAPYNGLLNSVAKEAMEVHPTGVFRGLLPRTSGFGLSVAGDDGLNSSCEITLVVTRSENTAKTLFQWQVKTARTIYVRNWSSTDVPTNKAVWQPLATAIDVETVKQETILGALASVGGLPDRFTAVGTHTVPFDLTISAMQLYLQFFADGSWAFAKYEDTNGETILDEGYWSPTMSSTGWQYRSELLSGTADASGTGNQPVADWTDVNFDNVIFAVNAETGAPNAAASFKVEFKSPAGVVFAKTITLSLAVTAA